MAKYIELEALMQAYREEQSRPGAWSFEGLVNSVPVADVAPVVHGKWEHTHTSESYFIECWRCSACGFDDTEGFGFEFCPFCGAKMDGET